MNRPDETTSDDRNDTENTQDNDDPSSPVSTRQRLTDAYNTMLGHVEQALKTVENRALPTLVESLAEARDQAVELGEVTADEAGYVVEFLKRDLEHAGAYLGRTGERLADWLAFDLDLIEEELLERFSVAADRTRIEWLEFNHELDTPVWCAGEIAGPGTLQCDDCGIQFQIVSATMLSDCQACGCDRFIRVHGESAVSLD